MQANKNCAKKFEPKLFRLEIRRFPAAFIQNFLILKIQIERMKKCFYA